MPETKGCQAVVKGKFMARSEEMANLVRHRIVECGAFVINDRKRSICCCGDLCRKPASFGIVDDQHGDIGFVSSPKCMDRSLDTSIGPR